MNTVKGELKDGVDIGGQLAKRFEMRAATAGDMFDAEVMAPPDRQVAYRGALMAQQLVSLGDVPGPIGFEVIRRLTPDDFTRLFDVQQELERVGKPASQASAIATT